MLEHGEDILWVSNMLGHADASMTLSKYAHYIKRDKKKRAQFLKSSMAHNVTNLTPSSKKFS
jgi:integrase